MGAGRLEAQIAAVYELRPDPQALVAEFREALLWCPVDPDGRLWCLESGAGRWLPAFTSPASLERFAVARGARPGEQWDYVTVRGFRLLAEPVLGAGGDPVGVAVDLGSERPVLLPPVAGVLPEGGVVR